MTVVQGATGSEAEATALLRELGLDYRKGWVGFSGDGWLVTILRQTRRPSLTTWMGLPIRYDIGGGAPKPF